ncbi:MAG: hypothetical protein FJ405_08690 [Verrucomicrobia bacterium]|nr:hypothetical protein [Verrucomicrobiota bacterium]
MARMLRIEYPDALYHVVSRGDRGEPVFLNDDDRAQFLASLGEAVEKTGWRIHAFGLLPAHFHLLLTTPNGNLVSGMKWLLGTYTARFNRRHKTSGHLFSGRYRSQVLDPTLPGIHAEAAAYIHSNPARAGLDPAQSQSWTSLAAYLAAPDQRLAWLATSEVFSALNLPDSAEGRDALAHHASPEPSPSTHSSWERFRSGWYLGGDGFRRELLDRIAVLRTPSSAGSVWKASAEQQADRLVREKLGELGWQEHDLEQRAKTDPEKVRLAAEVRRVTPMTVQWIASRLHMGTRNTLRNALLQNSKGVFKTPPQPPPPLIDQQKSEMASPHRNLSAAPAAFEPGWD